MARHDGAPWEHGPHGGPRFPGVDPDRRVPSDDIVVVPVVAIDLVPLLFAPLPPEAIHGSVGRTDERIGRNMLEAAAYAV